ncbi:Aste57867_11994 [Aphanomyces stellatus]|uniref:Aste57867_11994 protein n=1 Tax=Aphanomyces stellatus TaxID=120398 RepID=A0A485KUU9_9STRA|nr:hypothetical protein As57867_011949 [Aphanomyces stellatus]VFT88849.1 Aste57867_11994 [Aphanomyces stellatus]
MSKRIVTDLESTRADFAREFHDKYGGVSDNCVFNVDKTGIQFDMPPRYIWAKRGGNNKLTKGEKHSYRMTAVLTIRRDGHKLPIMFVIKGEPGGRIDKNEFKTYPSGNFYAI